MESRLIYLLDTNIWLERLLGQERSEEVGQMLDTLSSERFLLTDFALHSLGVILGRYKQQATLLVFVQDVLLDSDVVLVSVPPEDISQVIVAMDRFGLDFDDAYQYVAAEREEATIVSFDGHFDKTERGRLTPAEVLAIEYPS